MRQAGWSWSALVLIVAAGCALAAGGSGSHPVFAQQVVEPVQTETVTGAYGIPFRYSRALGATNKGRLKRGVQLPEAGDHHFTWDPVLERVPNRGKRRWGTYRTLTRTLHVLAELRRRYPSFERVGIGDVSRKRGGDFGPKFGGLGHASHQNGLDVDLYYPRLDGQELAPTTVDEVDRGKAQALVKAFVKAGARFVFVGPKLGLRGKRKVVVPWPNHDDHIHVRWSE